MPRYRAEIPPSVLYMVPITVHMPGSFSALGPSSAKEAVWIDSRVRTMSRGYVQKTEVIPAIPPHVRRARGERSAPGEDSKKFCESCCVSLGSLHRLRWSKAHGTHPLVKVVTAELNSRVRHNAHTVGAIASHEASPAFFPPHLGQTLADRQLVGIASYALNLEQDLEALEGGDDGSRDGTGNTAGTEGGNDGLGKGIAKPEVLDRFRSWARSISSSRDRRVIERLPAQSGCQQTVDLPQGLLGRWPGRVM